MPPVRRRDSAAAWSTEGLWHKPGDTACTPRLVFPLLRPDRRAQSSGLLFYWYRPKLGDPMTRVGGTVCSAYALVTWPLHVLWSPPFPRTPPALARAAYRYRGSLEIAPCAHE